MLSTVKQRSAAKAHSIFAENMKSYQLKIVVITICFAMIGLIGIQIYWIQNAFSLERDKIFHSSGEAIIDVIGQLERHETLIKIRSHQEAKYLFYQDQDSLDDMQFPPDDSLVEYVVSKQLERDGDEVRMQWLEEHEEQREEQHVTYSVSELPFESEMEKEVELKIAKANSIELEQGPSGERNVTRLQDIRNRVNSKKAFLGDIVKSLIEVDLNQPIEERIDPRVIDSLLSISLANHGVYIPFEMGVFDQSK